MPAAIEYKQPDERRDLTTTAAVEYNIRRQKYRTAMDYYLGKHPEQLEYDEFNDNVTINMIKMVADRTVSFLFPKMPNIQLEVNSLTDTPEEDLVKRVLDANGGLTMLSKAALRGFLAGHVFLRVKPAQPYPKIVLLDPLAVTVFWRADDVSEVLWYENRYYVGKTLYIEDYVHTAPDVWTIYTYKSNTETASLSYSTIPTPVSSANVSSLYNSTYTGGYSLINTAIHGSAIPPIIDIPHLPHPDDYYGIGEANELTLQNSINRIASEINRITRTNSDPVDVVIGADIDEVERGAGGLMSIANSGASVQRLELKGELNAIQEMLQKRIEFFLALSRVVLLRGEAKDLQRVTNASVRTLFLDALAKNSLLQAAYGQGLKNIVKLVLKMVGIAKDFEPKISWESPLPIDMTEIANINAIMVNLGARSKATAAAEMGDDWTFEKANIEAEHDWAIDIGITMDNDTRVLNDNQPVTGTIEESQNATNESV